MGEMRSVLLFQYERLVDTVMDFGSNVSLKLVVDIGIKDKDGNKRRSYEEYKYTSNKYKNENYLITAKRNFNSYLRIEYPSENKEEFNKGSIVIPPHSILGLRDKVRTFDDILFDPYYITRENKLDILSNKIVTIESYPMRNNKIEFSHSLYEGKDSNDLDYGVNIGFNNSFYFTIRSTTKWKEFVYNILTCDLYLWGSQLIAPYTAQLIGNSLNDTPYSSIKRYNIETVYEPEDYINNENSSNVVRTKPLDRESKIKSFFD